MNNFRGKNSQYSFSLNQAHLMSKSLRSARCVRGERVDRELGNRVYWSERLLWPVIEVVPFPERSCVPYFISIAAISSSVSHTGYLDGRNWLRALRPLLEFAVSIKWIAENPADDIKAKVPRKGEGFRAWGEEQIAAFRQHYAFGTRARLALELLLNTTQRRSDVVRMGPQHIRNGLLHVRQQKTGEPLQLPIFPELQAAIDAMPNRDRHLTFLTTKSGRPFSPAGFTNWLRHVCNGAGLGGFSAHGFVIGRMIVELAIPIGRPRPREPDLVQRVVGFRLTARCAAASVEAW